MGITLQDIIDMDIREEFDLEITLDNFIMLRRENSNSVEFDIFCEEMNAAGGYDSLE